MCLYGSPDERAEIEIIRRLLPSYTIVNPAAYEPRSKGDDVMDHFFQLIHTCHALVFSRLSGNITAGVGLEVNHALGQMPVFELHDGVISIIVSSSVQFLSREETLKAYSEWNDLRRNGSPSIGTVG
jgi:hypothetical protein